jgi:hypothetical protein
MESCLLQIVGGLGFVLVGFAVHRYAAQLAKVAIWSGAPYAKHITRSGKTFAEVFYQYCGATAMVLAGVMAIAWTAVCLVELGTK